MALKNQAITICYKAWNTSTNQGQTADASNHTLKLVQDGTEGTPTNSPSEVDSTNCKGTYKLALTAGDMNFNSVTLCGASSTANVVIFDVQIVTERGVLPTAAPANSGGFVTFGTGTGQLTTDGSGGVNVGQWLGHVPLTANIDGVPIVDVGYSDGLSWVAGTAQGVTANTQNTIILDPSAATIDDYYQWQTVRVDAGTGSEQVRIIIGYVGSTREATVNRDWDVLPDNTTRYSLGGTAEMALPQVLTAPRALDSIADGSITLNDALWCAVAAAAGKEDASSGTTMIVSTPSTGTTLRTFSIATSSSNPFGANFPVSRA